ncbi:MAG: rRNA maturation RNase YbeY [Gemmatimonadales bacterium]
MGPDVVVGGRPALPPALVRRVVQTVAAAGRPRRRLTQLSVTFLGPVRMRRLNRRHLRHDRVTDVIAFALRIPGGGLVGDVYVCRAVAARQAREAGCSLREELIRLVIHGTLHVLGHHHPAGLARTRSAMWRRQERLVGRLA